MFTFPIFPGLDRSKEIEKLRNESKNRSDRTLIEYKKYIDKLRWQYPDKEAK